jgi:hypothetical protein
VPVQGALIAGAVKAVGGSLPPIAAPSIFQARGVRVKLTAASKPGWRNWQTQRTQNPPRATSWGFDPPSRHQQNKELKLKWPLEIGEAKIVWWLFWWLLVAIVLQRERQAYGKEGTVESRRAHWPVLVNAQGRSTLRTLVCDRWNPVTLLANQVERHAYPESVQFASSPSCGLQFANCSHRVSAHRSMRRKVACCQRHCSQEHDDGNYGDGIVGSDSVQQPDDNACQSQRKHQS